jgi:hypothetical protein
MQIKFSVTRKSYVAPQSTASWESHKSELQRLYIDEDKTLNEIMGIMRAKGFVARSVRTIPPRPMNSSRCIFLTGPNSAKMYKSRFKEWAFIKNNRRGDVTRMLQVRRQRAAVGKPTTFKRNGKVVKIEDYLRRNGFILCHIADPDSPDALPEFIRCYTPRIDSIENLRPPEHHALKELMVRCLKDLCPSFTKIHRPNNPFGSPSSALWDTPRYLKLACDLFSESRNSQAGSICRSAFSYMHTLVYPPRLDTLFNFLVSQLWWQNRDITLEVWKYLAAYTSSVSGEQNEFSQLFRALSDHIQNHGYDAYLDFVTDCIDDMLAIHHSSPITRNSYFVGWCQLIVMETYYLNGTNPRVERIQSRCTKSLPPSRLFPEDKKLNQLLWRETFHMRNPPHSKDSRHSRFLRLAFDSYAKLLSQPSIGVLPVKPTCLLARIEGCMTDLSHPQRNPPVITKYNRTYTMETKILQFLARDTRDKLRL